MQCVAKNVYNEALFGRHGSDYNDVVDEILTLKTQKGLRMLQL